MVGHLDQSSDSDEDSRGRHDKFRSERFKEENKLTDYSGSRGTPRKSDHYSRKYRDKSPEARKRRRDNSPSYSRKSYSRREDDRKYRLKSSNSEVGQKSSYDKRHSESPQQCEESNSKKNKLSSLLENFDRQVKANHNSSNTSSQIGPVLPPHLQNVEEVESDKDSLVDSESALGPSLPPHFRNKCEKETGNLQSDKYKLTDIGPALPPHLKNKIDTVPQEEEPSPESLNSDIGPALPPHLKHLQSQEKLESNAECSSNKNDSVSIVSTNDSVNMVSEPAVSPSSTIDAESESEIKSDESSDKVEKSSVEDLNAKDNTQDMYGPSLPPKVETDSYGPALPPGFKKDSEEGFLNADNEREDSEDEEMVGPLPEGKMNMTQFKLDLRAMQIKKSLEDARSGASTDIKKREEWMLELPPDKASNFGLGPRSFRMKEKPDMSDRSSWTDTPTDKKRKEELALRGETEPVNAEEVGRKAFIEERDKAMDKISQTKDQDRPLSLLELHQKKLKKKKKKEDKKEKEGKKKERRPFDRNIDLQVNRFDDAQKKAIFKKAQLLNSRFSTGESKYL